MFAPSPCVDRQAGLDALSTTSTKWHIAFTSPSQEGIRAAVLAGLGITAQLGDDLRPGLKVIDGRYGLPPLPKAEFTLLWSPGNKTAASCELGQLLLSLAKEPPTRGGRRTRARNSTRKTR